jgi:exopolyphosphatase/pppGpp-phosphohydrolase
VDRVAIAREERRRQVTEDLEFERDRAGELRNEVNRLALELEGPAIDEDVFAKMQPEDVELVRGAVQEGLLAEGESVEEDWLDLGGDEAPEEDQVSDEQLAAELRQEQEAEIVRLQEEIAASKRRQQALEAYLEALDASAQPRSPRQPR